MFEIERCLRQRDVCDREMFKTERCLRQRQLGYSEKFKTEILKISIKTETLRKRDYCDVRVLIKYLLILLNLSIPLNKIQQFASELL